MSQRQTKNGGGGEFSVRAAIRFDPERFLAALNGSNGDQEFILKRPGRPPLVVPRELQAKEICAHLRVYVDELLDTAYSKGVETPRLRDLAKAPNARGAILRFSRENPPQFAIAGDSVSVEFLAGRLGTISDLMRMRGGVLEEPQQGADRYFGLLLLSGWQRNLARCRRAGCHRYFWLKHPNRTYKRGTCCPSCSGARSREAAVLSTARTRTIAEEALYRLVAQRFSKQIARGPNWFVQPRLKAAITEYLNEEIARTDHLSAVYRSGGRVGITSKWLGWARNRLGIERAVKKGTHAKG